MLIQAPECRPASDPAKSILAAALDEGICHEDLYRRLGDAQPDMRTRDEARDFLLRELATAARADGAIPQSPENLQGWMRMARQTVHLADSDYLSQRKQGASRRFFSNRAHALYFLRAAAPNKLVDGGWLYRLLPPWRKLRLSDLVRTSGPRAAGCRFVADQTGISECGRSGQKFGTDPGQSPALHWTPARLCVTRLFWRRVTDGPLWSHRCRPPARHPNQWPSMTGRRLIDDHPGCVKVAR